MVCPCCGNAISSPPKVEALKEIEAAELQRRLLTVLVDIYPKSVHKDQLVYPMYFDREFPSGDGVRKFITLVRKRIEPYGWTITKGDSAVARYALRKMKLGRAPKPKIITRWKGFPYVEFNSPLYTRLMNLAKRGFDVPPSKLSDFNVMGEHGQSLKERQKTLRLE